MKLFPPILLSRPALTRFIRARKARYSRSAGMIFILLVLVVSALIARRGAFAVTPQVECQPGALDTSFNGTGIVTTPISERYDVGRSVAIQADGKIVVAGYSYIDHAYADFVVVRYNSDGSLDTSFNGTGIVIRTL